MKIRLSDFTVIAGHVTAVKEKRVAQSERGGKVVKDERTSEL